MPPTDTDDAAYAYTLPEVARRLGLSVRTVQTMVQAGALPFVVVWGKRRISHRQLQTYLDRLEQPHPIDRMPVRAAATSAGRVQSPRAVRG